MSESKIDDSFPIVNFIIDRFSTPYWSDRDANGGGIMLYVREDIPANLLASENAPLESLYFKLSLRHTTWLLNSSYNPHKNIIQ